MGSWYPNRNYIIRCTLEHREPVAHAAQRMGHAYPWEPVMRWWSRFPTLRRWNYEQGWCCPVGDYARSRATGMIRAWRTPYGLCQQWQYASAPPATIYANGPVGTELSPMGLIVRVASWHESNGHVFLLSGRTSGNTLGNFGSLFPGSRECWDSCGISRADRSRGNDLKLNWKKRFDVEISILRYGDLDFLLWALLIFGIKRFIV